MRTEEQAVREDAVGDPLGRDGPSDAVRKRAAVELIHRDERTLRRTARRYSVCEDDAEDAYQRALEILLTKAPTADPRELIRWMQTYRTRAVPWTTFAPLKADSKGRFRLAYTFKDDESRGVRFEFRALAVRETGWPYAPAASRAQVVVGR